MRLARGDDNVKPTPIKGRFAAAGTHLAGMRTVAIPGLAAMFMSYSVSGRIYRCVG